jgi:mannose-6-phosphate isomerase-like protein (cupin superfamily)
MHVKKKWGWEQWIQNNDKYCLKVIYCENDIWSSDGKFHYHPVKDETFYILSGILELNIRRDGIYLTHHLFAEDYYRVEPGVHHRFRSNAGYCKFIEASTTHREEDSIRVD